MSHPTTEREALFPEALFMIYTHAAECARYIGPTERSSGPADAGRCTKMGSDPEVCMRAQSSNA